MLNRDVLSTSKLISSESRQRRRQMRSGVQHRRAADLHALLPEPLPGVQPPRGQLLRRGRARSSVVVQCSQRVPLGHGR